MIPNQFSRTELLLGAEAMERLATCRVAVFGLGGVGGYTVEALARSGIGALDLIDNDCISPTNLNRQLLATHSTLGMDKVEVAAARILSINPDCRIEKHKVFYLPETADRFDFTQYDYIVDAIDTVSGKLQLVEAAHRVGTPIISSMGTGNKLHPERFEVADISKTSVCPLARVMRKELKHRGILHLKVVYSREKALTPLAEAEREPGILRRSIPGSSAFVPGVAGLIIAGEVVRDLIGHVDPPDWMG